MEKLSDHLYIEPMGKIIADNRAVEKAAKPRRAKRLYSAANVNRLNKDWTTTPYTSNYSLYRDLRILRARARDMCANAAHFHKFLAMAKSNIIGPKGIQLQVRATVGTRPHTALNTKVELAFWEWSFSENCSISGKLDWTAQQNLFVEHLIRDGEALVQCIDAGRFGLQLKFWNVDYLDETYNEELRDGRRIIMSVELDANDKPVAYWLTTPPSDINFTKQRSRQRVRIPADEMIHAFIVTDEESQARGVTWFAAGLLEGRNHHVYKGSVIDSAKMTAMSGGFFTKDAPDETEFTGEEDEDGIEQEINIDFSPASFHVLEDGMNFQQFDPKQPTQNHPEFVKTILHDIAAAFGVNYFSLAGDMASVNYSSARVGLREERDLWRSLQNFVATCLCRPVYHRWLKSAMLSGKLELSAKDFQNVQNPKWCPRGWSYVDPQKEIKADIDALANNLTTLTDVLSEQGIDITEHFETLKTEKELAATYGIELKYGQQPTAAAADPGEETDDTTGGDSSKKTQDDEAREYTNGKYVS
jgi:lambda family phage portal protein